MSVVSMKCDVVAILEQWRDWRMEAFDGTPGVLLEKVRAYVNACQYLVLSVTSEICATNLFAKNFGISNEQAGPPRSAAVEMLFIVVHADGSLHVVNRPGEFHNRVFLSVCLYWTGLRSHANVVEGYVLLSASLHVFVGVKRR